MNAKEIEERYYDVREYMARSIARRESQIRRASIKDRRRYGFLMNDEIRTPNGNRARTVIFVYDKPSTKRGWYVYEPFLVTDCDKNSHVNNYVFKTRDSRITVFHGHAIERFFERIPKTKKEIDIDEFLFACHDMVVYENEVTNEVTANLNNKALMLGNNIDGIVHLKTCVAYDQLFANQRLQRSAMNRFRKEHRLECDADIRKNKMYMTYKTENEYGERSKT